MRTTLLAIFLLASVSASASFEFDPIAPTDRSFIYVQVREMWRDGCLPQSPRVTRNGTIIEVLWSRAGDMPCTLMVSEWNAEAPIGVLPAGVYDVILKVDDGGVRTLATKKLIIREAAPAFEISPRVVSITEPGIVSLWLCETPGALPLPWDVTVTVDGVAVPSQTSWCWVNATLPAHAAGPVNVTARIGNRELEVINGIHYIDPAAAPEPSLYERVLVPIVFDGPGAYGSRWFTETEMYNASQRNYRFLPDVNKPLTRLANHTGTPLSIFGNRPAGLLLFVPRGADLRFGSLARNPQRQYEDYGVEVPIVREGDADWRVILPNVPFDRRFRLQLRVYDIDGLPGAVSVHATRDGGSSAVSWVRLEGPCEHDQLPCNSNRPAYGSIDLTSALAAVRNQGSHRLTVSGDRSSRRLWAFVTVTNNETQRVTVISPQ